MFKYVVYKLTFPNGKIYIGKDVGGEGHDLGYFGSCNGKLIEKDFTKQELTDFYIRKQILFESESKQEVSQKENYFIRLFNSNKDDIGYNRTLRKKKSL